MTDGGPLALLLLEDSAFDADLVQEAVRASHPDAQCMLVRDEAGFVQALASQRFDAVLSDYQLPGFGGELALDIARARAPGLPFIFVSGVIGEDNAVELLKRGATDYVSKGRLERLPLVLARALREVREREGLDAAQARLREADRLYGRIVESLRDYAVLLLDAEHRITSWNRGAQAMFGFERAEAVGQNAMLLLPAGEEAQEAWRRDLRLAATAQRAATQRWMQRRDGSRLWAEGVLMPLHGDSGALAGWCSITRDTTAEHLAAQALREAKEQAEAARHEAERANRAKDRFIAMLSHELRAPLSAVSAAAHLLERHASLPPQHQDLVPLVRRNVAVEARLIDDLLDISAISSGKLGIKPEPVDMHVVLREVLQMLGEALSERGMQLALDLADGPAWVLADPVRMQQVVANLVRNAIKFSEPGGVVRLHTALEAGEFVFSCCDHGIGIAADALERIFTAFEQADSATARERGGLGLGLAIARHLALAHGGVLLADSPGLGQGARFTLRLPLQQAAVPPPPPAGAADPAPARSARVLMVEDHPGAALALRMCLEDYGYAVEHAASVAEALRLAQELPFDIVLTDLGLPDGSGVDIGRALSSRLPVLALSGYGAESDLRSTAQAGFAGHLVKPVDPPQVHALLQKLLARAAP
ncbi:hybrid sensor histidine kinase/response regulator [Pseudorhodoferax sp.]|uniref:hybrid sensor histidine kinase/response regulator n=1 Tax=Pseudorhodoferax sp. TaxID=1993553 RepID=UPI002DD62297|nr:response regulator [Pseudorhodoferax sp.]